ADDAKPYCHFFAYRSSDMSAIPICMAMLQNHAKKVTCQKVNLLWPSRGTPVQILVSATGQKSDEEVTPSSGRTATAAAIKIMIIQGAARLANLATWSKPNMATTVVTAPTTKTVRTHPTLLG